MNKKVWKVLGGNRVVKTKEELEEFLLMQRGIEREHSAEFYNPDYERDIHDPFLLHGMKKAVDRIAQAKKNGEHVLVYGDYDADGVTSTAILVSVLKKLGIQVTPYIPDRAADGYGLNQDVLDSVVNEAGLVITVDCGISNYDEIKWLADKGVDVIVVDHHMVPDKLPPALAIIHPDHPQGSYPEKKLCGAGVAWKVASALAEANKDLIKEEWHKWLLDLAALGTVADMMPLLGENRAIVTFGIEVLRRTKRIGLRALLQATRVNMATLGVEDMSFQILPSINSAGRMEHAQPALELLLCEDIQEAEGMVRKIQSLNRKRQEATRQVMAEAEKQVGQSMDSMLIAYDINWHIGVVGLVAGRLSDKFGRPALVIGGNGDVAVGSARAPRDTNIVDLLKQGDKFLDKMGGHAQAAGLSLSHDNVDNLKACLQKEKVAVKVGAQMEKEMMADVIVEHDLINSDTVELLDKFAPFGEGNKPPKLVIKGVPVAEIRTVGKLNEHLKFVFNINDRGVDGIGFKLANENSEMNTKVVDILGVLEENEWQGRRRIQLRVIDFAPMGSVKYSSE